MLPALFSKPIFRLSVVILVNENLLRATPVLAKDIKSKHFARWVARKPSKVFTTDEMSSGSMNTEEFFKSEYADDSLEKESPKRDNLSFEKESNKRSKKGSEKEKQKEFDHSNNVQDARGIYPPGTTVHSSNGNEYAVLEEHDFTFSKLMTQVGNRNMRKKHNLIMLEGKRLNVDALQAGLVPKKIFFTQLSLLEDLDLPPGSRISLFKLPYKTVKLWSKLDVPPGIIGFYGIPKEEDITKSNTVPVKVVCDNVRDPGNMGSIIRVAASVGCSQIVLMKGCTDPWDAKVLRSASGGHFHIPILMDMTWREHKEFLDPSDLVFLADSNTQEKHPYSKEMPLRLYYDVNYTTPNSIVVVIGGETEGLSYDAFSLASHHNGSRLYIPLSNCVESLNSGCALSVILFEIKKQILTGGKVSKTESLAQHQMDSSEQVSEDSRRLRSSR